jgi:hypothetical protein
MQHAVTPQQMEQQQHHNLGARTTIDCHAGDMAAPIECDGCICQVCPVYMVQDHRDHKQQQHATANALVDDFQAVRVRDQSSSL